MKKTLLLLLTLMCSVGMWAEDLVVTYDFSSRSNLPNGFPTATGTNATSEKEVTMTNGAKFGIVAKDAYYSASDGVKNSGKYVLFFGKNVNTSKTTNTDVSSAYLKIPGKAGYKISKVKMSLPAGNAGGVNVNIFTKDYAPMSTEQTTVNGTAKEFTFELTTPTVNTSYYYTVSKGVSAGKNLQIYSMVVTYTADNSETYLVNVANNIIGGTISANPITDVTEGATVTLSATPADGYKFGSWNVTNASTSEAITVTDNQFTMPAANVNVSATFTEIVYRTIKWSVNGNTSTIDPLQVEDGANIIFPTDLADINGKKFVGWSANSAASSPSDLVSGNVVASADVTYYAVFADRSGSTNLSKLGKSDTFSDGDNIAIFAHIDTKYYGLYQETVSNSYINFYVLEDVPTLNDVSGDAKKTVTLSTANANTWYLGDDTNGYLYNNSNNMYASTAEGEKSEYTITWNDANNAFTIKNGSRWIACRSDLTGDNQYKYRGAGTSGSPTTNSTGYLEIYRIENDFVYSNYTTTITADPTYAYDALSLVAQDADGYYWATFSNAKDVFMDAADIITYVVTVDGSKMKLSDEAFVSEKLNAGDGEIDGIWIPANTGVLIMSSENEVGYYTVENANVAAITADNMLYPASKDKSELADHKFYKLAYASSAKDGLGFYWGAANGGTFTSRDGSAYLAVPTGPAAKSGFKFNDDEATGINNVKAEVATGVAYNLAGQRVNATVKGIVIMNGKKFINK